MSTSYAEVDLFPSLPRNTVVRTIRDEWNALRRANEELGGIVSPAHAARVLGVSRQRMHQMIDAGQIRAIESDNFSYVSASDVQERLAMRVKPGRPKRS